MIVRSIVLKNVRDLIVFIKKQLYYLDIYKFDLFLSYLY